MSRRGLLFVGLLALALSVQGITENQKLLRRKRNVGSFPDFSDSLSQLQMQSQSQTINGQWQSQSQSQSQSQGSVVCDPPCKHGKCTLTNECSCEAGWSGATCEEFECVDTCVHGRCVAPNTCECNEGWGGSSCHEAECESVCLNGGVCSAPNTCSCKNGYTGETCNTPVCDVPCQNGGSCTAPNMCTCPSKFEGTLCQIALPSECQFPFEYNGNLYSACTTVDSTDDKPWCSTTTAYEGNRITCDYESLCKSVGDIIEIPGDCMNYYVCGENGEISLETCGSGTVFNVLVGTCDSPSNTPRCSYTCAPACENNGVCMEDNVCECQSGFTGKRCEIVEEEISGASGQEPVVDNSFEEGSALLPESDRENFVCSIWGQENFFTFDGVQYSSPGRCGYELLKDCAGKTFEIGLTFDQVTGASVLTMTILTPINQLVLSNGKATWNGENIPIPSIQNGVKIVQIPNTEYIMITGAVEHEWIAWDGKDTFSLSLGKNMRGKVCGLCGNMNGDPLDDLTPKNGDIPAGDLSVFMDSWSLNGSCSSGLPVDFCGFLNETELEMAVSVCKDVANSLDFSTCDIPDTIFEQNCLTHLCQCSSGDYKSCICDAATVYTKLCIANGANMSEWRSNDFCPKTCPNNLVYSECGTTCPSSCRNKNQQLLCTEQCVEGCFCPPGTYLDGDVCVTAEECSCTHLGESFANKAVRTEACQECTCNGGSWTCAALDCSGECSATSDRHYSTFDGLSYTYPGTCQYAFASDFCNGNNGTFYVVIENKNCGSDDEGVCTKVARIALFSGAKEFIYELKVGGVVAVDGNDVSLPYSNGDVQISYLSSVMITMKTSRGIEIEWDGAARFYLKLEQSWKNRVCGLCGNFNSKSADDMKTPQNVLETNAAHFGNSWKVNAGCPNVESEQPPVLPGVCLINRDRLTLAEEACGILKTDVFKPCHRFVDWQQYYKDCRSDVCECTSEEDCSCNALLDYARACSRAGQIISWRSESVCPATCAEGMEYHECAGYCGNTCKSIGDKNEVCSSECQPGCVCAEGLYLTELDTCVEIQDCGCFYEGQMYEPGATVVIDTMTCDCSNGKMTCETKQEDDVCVEPEKYVDCGSLPKGSTGIACLATCQDPKLFCESSTCHCLSGCACPEGTIKDEILKKCVKPEQCSCIHDGKVHQSGDVISPDTCNECTCNGGTWSCTEKACNAECSSIGDPHFNTFDGRTFDFQGDCSYVMAEDFCGDEETGSFRVFIETIPCGDNGVTCTKAVTIHLYNYYIHLTKGEGEPVVRESILNSTSVPSAPAHVSYNIRRGTIYYIVETSIGVDILWNANNAVKIKLQPQYMNSVCGLCGNYDGDMTNDFMMRAGDVAADPNMFGNDWKSSETCPDANGEPHPCDQNPTIAPWAEKRCSIITSDVFEACHNLVDPTKFYDSCLYDTCGCNAGGDCECFCTAVAAYAQACTEANVCINWRNNDVCPVMCEAYDKGFGSGDDEICEWKYDTCGNPCPPTCTDPNPESCPWAQLEGCYVTCKEDQVWDDVAGKCINKADCPPIPTTTPKPDNPTTVSSTTPKTIPTTTTTPAKTTTTEAWCECVDQNGIAHSPGETWPLRGDESLCVDMTCVEESPGVCRTESDDKAVLCKEENRPVCQNGYYPIAVQDGCSCHWECQCYCFGQGDPHFFTFDGYYYPFQGNCTFVLSRDMNAHRSNFPHEYEIWMDNIPCEEAPETTCTRKMTIRYNNTQLVLLKNYTYSINGGPLRKSNTLPINANGIHLEMRGISLFYLTIPEINVVFTFTANDYSWSLSVPYSKYVNRTEGLCGICNNDQGDDLTNREGELETVIEDFGDSWLVRNESTRCFKNDTCSQPSSKKCEIILSDVFEACHGAIDPEIFYEMCLYDTSKCGNYTYCEAAFGYARACHHEGICIDWRREDVCPISCPSDRIYEACKPGCDKQCTHYVSEQECEAEEAVEGCFCPPGTVQLNGDCVDEDVCTNCVDDDGTVYEYGQSWVPESEDCTICSCMEGQKVVCTDKKCPNGTNVVPTCSSCFVPEVVRGSDPCCPTYQCVCNYITDAGSENCDVVSIPDCGIGYIAVRTNPEHCVPHYECQCDPSKSPCIPPPVCGELEHLVTHQGDCCPTYSCECNKCQEDVTECGECENKMTTVDACGCEHYHCESRNVCRFNGTDKLPGDRWDKTVCETCTCQTSNTNNEGCYEAECYVQSCSTSCPPCSEYTTVPGQCCGTCVEVQCLVAYNNNTQCREIDSTWHNYERCEEYMCQIKPDGSLGVSVNPVSCPVRELPSCPTCYRLDSYTKDCCPEYHCVPDDVCCMDGPTIKVPGESWAPDTCTNCKCTNTKNETSGFHVVQCDNIPCPSFDQEACDATGGHAVPTNDGCCLKCDNKCIDEKNNTHLFGETWKPDNCTICSCAEGHEIVCNPMTCPDGQVDTEQNCGKCEVSRRRADSDPCCPVYDCVCNYDFAKGEANCDSVPVPTCEPGYVPVQTNVGACIPKYACVCNMTKNPCPESPTCNEELEDLIRTETDCCPIETCECKLCAEDTTSCSPCQQTIVTYDACGCKHVTCDSLDVCLSDGMLHPVNGTWNPDVCTSCECTSDFDQETSCHFPLCQAQSCHVTCPACHEYVEIAGQCCGTCVETGCPVMDTDGQLVCAKPGESWSYLNNCTEYMCAENMTSGGLEVVPVEVFTCPRVEVPECGPCHRIESYDVDCCTRFRCVAQEVCCDNKVGKLPGSSWSPSACETCYCSDDMNATSGFHVEKCYQHPCPPIDEDACVENGGMLTATDDGCCMKCQIAECYECGKRISTSLEYMVVDECASTVPISLSYCDGFCRGSYFWSADGPDSQCSCCNPTSTEVHSVMMKCKNGTQVEYQYDNVLSCGCTATCSPQPPTVTPKPEAPVTTTTTPAKTTTTEEPEESGSGEVTVTIPEAPVTTTTTPPKTIPETTTTTTTEEPEESGSGEVTVTIPEAPVTTTTTPPKTIPETTTTTTTEEPEESGSGEVTVTIPEAPVTTTTTPPKTIPETTTTTTTEEPEESGSGEVTVTIPEAPVTTTTTPPKTIPETTTTTTTEEPEESGSGEVTVTIPEAPVTTTTTPPKTIPETTTTTTTEEPEESGSGEVTVTIPEAPVTTTTTPPKTIPETTTTTTTEEPEESGSGEVTVTIPEAPVTTTTTPPKTIPETTTTTTTEEPEESGSGEVTVTIPEAPVTTTTTPPKTIPETTTTTTTEEPEESGSGEVTVTIPEAPVTTTTTPPKTIPETTTTTTTEEPEESGSGEVTVTIPEAPVTTTTTPPKTIPETTTTTTTEEPEESGSGEVTVTIPEAPVTTTTTPPKTIPETTTTTTTEEPEESGSGEVTVTIPEAPVTTTTTPPKTIPETTITTTTEEPEESGSGEVTVTIPEAPVTTTTTPPKTIPETTTTTTTEEPEESGSGEVTVTIPEAPATTTTTTEKTIPNTSSTPTTTLPTTTTTEATTTLPTTTTTEATTTVACYWSDWISSGKPKLPIRDDNETYAHVVEAGFEICEKPEDIQCRPVGHSQEDFASFQEWQTVSCDVNVGLLCLGSQQTVHPVCEDYEIRVYCCPSSNNGQSEAEQEVNMVQQQVQHLITNIENGNSPSSSNFEDVFANVQHQQNTIDHNLETIIHNVNNREWHQGSEYEQAQAQQHMQQEIQTLDHSIQQQAHVQHMANVVVSNEVDNILNSIEHVPGPVPPNKYVDEAINNLNEQISHNAEAAQEVNVELKNSIHNLVQNSHVYENENLINDMKDLEQHQSNLMHQEQAQLNSLNNLATNDEHQLLSEMVGQQINQNQQVNAVEDELEALSDQY